MFVFFVDNADRIDSGLLHATRENGESSLTEMINLNCRHRWRLSDDLLMCFLLHVKYALSYRMNNQLSTWNLLIISFLYDTSKNH